MAEITLARTSTAPSLTQSPKRYEITKPIGEQPQAEQELAVLVGQSFETLRVFGKEPGQLKTITRTFLMMLAEFPIIRVRAAFIAWMKTQSEMPTPADIIGLIDGGNAEWKWIFICLDQVKNGGSVSQDAVGRLEKALGKNWREYV
jgi:hypothetical protein